MKSEENMVIKWMHLLKNEKDLCLTVTRKKACFIKEAMTLYLK